MDLREMRGSAATPRALGAAARRWGAAAPWEQTADPSIGAEDRRARRAHQSV
jgi:hypothetical protein